MKNNLKQYINIPNSLTLLRIIVIPPIILSFVDKNYVLALIFLVISGLTDFFDGKLARKFNQITKLGAVLDPIADKLTLLAIVVCLGIAIPVTTPLVIFLFIKEILMLSGGLLLMKKKLPIPSAKWYGKLSTFIFYSVMLTIVICYAFLKFENMYLAYILMVFTSLCMAYSLVRYFLLFKYILTQNRKENG